MKALFLDIDGVCNCAKTFQRGNEIFGIDPYMAFLVGKIVIATGCVIVLSSSWRHNPDAVSHVEKRVGNLYGQTPRSGNGFRGDEVREWLLIHPEITRYAILDDDGDFWEDQPLFKTSWENGITEEIAKAVTEYLNGID